MKTQIKKILTEYNFDRITFDEATKALLLLCNSSLHVKDKQTPTIEDYLTEVEGFNLSDTESYIEDYSLNFNKYQKKYKNWLTNL